MNDTPYKGGMSKIADRMEVTEHSDTTAVTDKAQARLSTIFSKEELCQK
jgi:hypothetical protein